MMVVRSQSTAEPAVLPMLTPVAVAVRQTLFEQQISSKRWKRLRRHRRWSRAPP